MYDKYVYCDAYVLIYFIGKNVIKNIEDTFIKFMDSEKSLYVDSNKLLLPFDPNANLFTLT